MKQFFAAEGGTPAQFRSAPGVSSKPHTCTKSAHLASDKPRCGAILPQKAAYPAIPIRRGAICAGCKLKGKSQKSKNRFDTLFLTFYF
jgi:hypothetical protein